MGNTGKHGGNLSRGIKKMDIIIYNNKEQISVLYLYYQKCGTYFKLMSFLGYYKLKRDNLQKPFMESFTRNLFKNLHI